ncbi:MAG TPA: hypothetical protein VJQ43_05145 [Thermoplasmata archaeon]|nr:hypothetical protein [Thermoplasmata archaeon]
MAVPDPAINRVAELERQVAELRRRLAVLEARFLDPGNPHPEDAEVVKEKVRFDWQS